MKKKKQRKKSESFSRILNASNVIHGQLSSLVKKKYSFASKIFSCERKKVSSLIYTKYILYICATIEIYMYAIQWEPIDRLAGVVRVSPVQLKSGNFFRSYVRIYKCSFVEFAIAVFVLTFLSFI